MIFKKLKIIIYYILISKLPHSRFSSAMNKIRVWYLSKILKVIVADENSKFENDVDISDASNIKIGKYCRINECVFLQGHVNIGDFVMIAPYAAIYSSTHYYANSKVPMVTFEPTSPQEVRIADDVWIGRNAVILPGI